MRSIRLPMLALATALLVGCGAAPTSLHALGPAGSVQAQSAKRGLKADFPATENFTQVDEKLYRGGWLTEDDMRKLAKLGVKNDVCLLNPRAADEKAHMDLEKKMCDELGMTFVSIVVPWGGPPTNAMVGTFFKAVDDGPTYVHCRHGRDRTGTMAACYRIQYYGYSNEKAFDEMKSFGFNPSKYPFYAAFVKGFKRLNDLNEAS